jgi:HSP20 family protein
MTALEVAFPELADLERSLTTWADGLRTRQGERRAIAFPVDIYETGEAFWVRAELAGMEMKDIDVQLVGQQLVIKAQRPQPELPQGAAVVRAELPVGQFLRTFEFGVPVEAEQVQAKYRNGLLDIHVPKAQAVRPRSVPIQLEAAQSQEGPRELQGSGS